ncbi:MAG TPA: NUDIX hydrolase N-terminal domain-containing protein, partial [Micromonosporaceae bacterium]
MQPDRLPVEIRIGQLAEELRAIAANGLHYTDNPYDQDRYQRTRDLAAELHALVTGGSIVEVQREYVEQPHQRTPAVGADAAVFDDEGRIL